MARFILWRTLIAVPVLLGVTVVAFFIISVAPGDPVDFISAGGEMDQQARAKLRESFGLDKPVYVRYVTWLANIAQGNLGRSYVNSQPVSLRIGERVVPTFSLMLSALALSFLVAVPVGALSALRRYSILDYASTPFALLGVSVPVPFLGLAAIYVISLKLHVLPTGGLSTAGADFSLGDRLSHLLLPAAVLGLHELGSIMRYTRSSVLEVVEQDYVRTARAKGVPAVAVVVRHVLRNALLPLVTLVGLSLPRLFGGAIIAEQIFQWPGMGRLAIEAILARDYPVLMGLNLMTAVLVLVGNLVADVTYALVDPRVRLTR
jgi:peptide/nickel transport system permease protein